MEEPSALNERSSTHLSQSHISLSIMHLAVKRHHGVAKHRIMMSSLTATGKGKVVPENTMKAQRWSRRIAPPTLTLVLDGDELVSLT